jgi:hypothetical protein
MSYYAPDPPTITVGSEFVSIEQKIGAPRTARILRREVDAKGSPTKLVLDRMLGYHGAGNVIFDEETGGPGRYGGRGSRRWYGTGCFATVLSRTTSDESNSGGGGSEE